MTGGLGRGATFIALIVSTLILFLTVSLMGVSDIGKVAFSGSATMGWANTTYWGAQAALAGFPLSFIFIILILGGILLLVMLAWKNYDWMQKQK